MKWTNQHFSIKLVLWQLLSICDRLLTSSNAKKISFILQLHWSQGYQRNVKIYRYSFNFVSTYLHKNGTDDPEILLMTFWNINNRISVGISSVHPLDIDGDTDVSFLVWFSCLVVTGISLLSVEGTILVLLQEAVCLESFWTFLFFFFDFFSSPLSFEETVFDFAFLPDFLVLVFCCLLSLSSSPDSLKSHIKAAVKNLWVSYIFNTHSVFVLNNYLHNQCRQNTNLILVPPRI